jgi:hypothetical protein
VARRPRRLPGARLAATACGTARDSAGSVPAGRRSAPELIVDAAPRRMPRRRPGSIRQTPARRRAPPPPSSRAPRPSPWAPAGRRRDASSRASTPRFASSSGAREDDTCASPGSATPTPPPTSGRARCAAACKSASATAASASSMPGTRSTGTTT